MIKRGKLRAFLVAERVRIVREYVEALIKVVEPTK
jgi:hypothetical protein